jgi:predicted trehalose synthase
MIHSRPGYQTRVTHEGKKAPPPAKIQPDMQPAIMKHTTATGATKSPLAQSEQPSLPVERMQAEAEAAFKRMQEKARMAGPELLVNPAPSATPVMTSPHKE